MPSSLSLRVTTPQASPGPSQRPPCPGLSSAGTLATRKDGIRDGHGTLGGAPQGALGHSDSGLSPGFSCLPVASEVGERGDGSFPNSSTRGHHSP